MIKDYLEQPKVIDITHKNVANIKSENIVVFSVSCNYLPLTKILARGMIYL